MQGQTYGQHLQYYKIYTPLNSNYCWDCSGKTHKLILYKYHGGDNQKFFLSILPNKKWRIQVKETKQCLTVVEGKEHLQISLQPWKDIPSQYWQLIKDPLKPKQFVIKSFAYQNVCDLQRQKVKNESKIICYPAHGGSNQIWILEEL